MAVSFMVFLCCCILGLAAVKCQDIAIGNLQNAGRPIHTDAGTIIGPLGDFAGNQNCPYKLVEFGDYECPPCHEANTEVPGILKIYESKVKFEFRNFPLTNLHPFAARAALIAEEARGAGKFWQVHEALYSEPVICAASLDRIELSNNLQVSKMSVSEAAVALGNVNRDVICARSVGVTGTPTFFLCCPSGQVILLRSIKDIAVFVR
jgi:protein-disulfide isomerase